MTGIPDSGCVSGTFAALDRTASANDLQLFKFEHQPIRVVLVEGEPWFVLSDLCRVLGIANVGNVVARLHEDDRNRILDHGPLDAYTPQDARDFAAALLAAADTAEASE